MPTPESAAAFARLVAMRTSLSQVNEQLHLVEIEIRGSAAYSERRIAAEDRYARLQAEWDRAFRDLELATKEYSALLEGPQSKSGSDQVSSTADCV
jgi:hypothetical protein